jgi:hypothetical protein
VNTRALLFVLLAAPAVPTPADVGLKITTRDSWMGLPPSQRTQYIAGDRRRSEFRSSSGANYGPPLAFLSRCDLGQIFELNLEDKQYVYAPFPHSTHLPSEAERQAYAAKYAATAAKQTPTILVEITTVDTGERKKVFGYDARHVITTERHTRLNGSKEVEQENVTDGWYTDLSTTLSCEPKTRGSVGFLTMGALNNVPTEVPSWKFVGKPESGFALSKTTKALSTYVLPDGSKGDSTSTSQMQVTELYSGPLNPELFEVPHGFTKVDRIRSEPSVPFSVRVQEYWNMLKMRMSRLFS